MSYPWTDLRLTQAVEVAAEHGCACAVDVESLVGEVRRLTAELDAARAWSARWKLVAKEQRVAFGAFMRHFNRKMTHAGRHV